MKVNPMCKSIKPTMGAISVVLGATVGILEDFFVADVLLNQVIVPSQQSYCQWQYVHL